MSVKDSQKLKGFQSRKAKLEVEIDELKEQQRGIQSKLSKAQNQLNGILGDIEALKDKDIVISEHAILRYIERAMGLDLEQIKASILTDANKAAIKRLGNCKFPIGEGLKAVVKDNCIVSITD